MVPACEVGPWTGLWRISVRLLVPGSVGTILHVHHEEVVSVWGPERLFLGPPFDQLLLETMGLVSMVASLEQSYAFFSLRSAVWGVTRGSVIESPLDEVPSLSSSPADENRCGALSMSSDGGEDCRAVTAHRPKHTR